MWVVPMNKRTTVIVLSGILLLGWIAPATAQNYRYTAFNQPPYQCGSINGFTHFPDGVCLPKPAEPNIPSEIRFRLYATCASGLSRLGAQRNCCEHLTEAQKHAINANCPSFGGDSNIPWEEILRVAVTLYLGS